MYVNTFVEQTEWSKNWSAEQPQDTYSQHEQRYYALIFLHGLLEKKQS